MENLGKTNIFLIISFLILSSAISQVLFSTIALSQTVGQSSTTSGTSGTSTTESKSETTTTTPTTQTTATTDPSATETKQETTQAPLPEEKPLPLPPAPEPVPSCPAPPQSIACRENQGSIPKFDDKGCVTSYDCKDIPKVEVGQVAICPQVPQPTITCQANEQLSKTTDDKGCVVGYNCISTAPPTEVPIVCPAVAREKPPCDGGIAPILDKGCLIGYTCVPQGCRQENDQSGFVRVVCSQERVCAADQQQAELKSHCFSQGGNPISFQDPSGCTFYDCRFDNREINPSPIAGHQSCPQPEEIEKMARQCKDTGLAPGVVFEGGCKIVRCTQEKREERSCGFVPGPERIRIENECSARGLPAISATDAKGCQYFRCGDSQQMTCQRDVPSEAYKGCNSKGGEMIVKNDDKGCVVFSQCVLQGDDKQIYVNPVEEVPDATALLSLALKLEKLKIELEKLADESNEIAKYYASTESLDEERYTRVSAMFGAAAGRIDEIKTKIRDNVDSLTKDDLEEIRHDIKYLKEITLKDILYLMLSNSDDVRETLESSKKISVERASVEELEANAKSCGTDGSCFDRAIRSCKPVTFQPEGRNGPLIAITGLKDEKCVLHITMPSNMVPPGFSKDNFYMDCPIPNYALGVRGPEDVIPNCEGPMAKFAKQFGGAAQISGGGDAFQDIIEKEGGPGGCKTEKECATYCVDNYDECKQWVKKHPAVGPLPSRDELGRFASGEKSGREFEQRGFAGPGGCKGPQECDKFCRNNPQECLRWCDENPDLCPQERSEFPEKFKGSPEEFVSQQPVSRAPQPISRPLPSGVQACVGCLNNGICDIGECSECIDCLKGGRSITGEIARVG